MVVFHLPHHQHWKPGSRLVRARCFRLVVTAVHLCDVSDKRETRVIVLFFGTNIFQNILIIENKILFHLFWERKSFAKSCQICRNGANAALSSQVMNNILKWSPFPRVLAHQTSANTTNHGAMDTEPSNVVGGSREP